MISASTTDLGHSMAILMVCRWTCTTVGHRAELENHIIKMLFRRQ
jgi:hypothetical protein